MNVKLYHRNNNPWAQIWSTKPFEIPGSKLDMKRALCRGRYHPNEDLDPMFVDNSKDPAGEKDEDGRYEKTRIKTQLTQESVALCKTGDDGNPCPIRTECFIYALTNKIEWGVWGGTTAAERRELRLQKEAREGKTHPGQHRAPGGRFGKSPVRT